MRFQHTSHHRLRGRTTASRYPADCTSEASVPACLCPRFARLHKRSRSRHYHLPHRLRGNFAPHTVCTLLKRPVIGNGGSGGTSTWHLYRNPTTAAAAAACDRSILCAVSASERTALAAVAKAEFTVAPRRQQQEPQPPPGRTRPCRRARSGPGQVPARVQPGRTPRLQLAERLVVPAHARTQEGPHGAPNCPG